MNRYPYKPGDRGNHRETNEMMEFVRRESMRQPNSDAENSVLVKSHKMIEPYSVFGVGQDGANEKAFPQPVRLKDPIGESSAPYYVNRSQAMNDDANWWVVPLGPRPEEITLEGTVEPGDRAKPNDDGKAVKDDSGELLCVSDTVEGRASFVYSPIPSTGTLYVEFTLPSELTNQQTTKADCPVDRFWGGNDPGATITITNRQSGLDNTRQIHTGNAQAKGLAVYDEGADVYRIIGIECSI